MAPSTRIRTGAGAHDRRSYVPPISGPHLPTQEKGFVPPHYPFQKLPPPKNPAPYRFDLSQLLKPEDVTAIKTAGTLVFHSVGDTGDFRGAQKDFVAAMMVHDVDASAEHQAPAFFYHLGDVVYFAGDIDKYGDNFYETYKDYPPFIVSIPGNHDCQPDDPQDGPVDPNKAPLDGWVKNFMSSTPDQLGSLKTGAGRTQMDLPNVYWTFTTPFATIIGLFSNVGESEGEIHQDQIDWFKGELAAADPSLALIVTVHHPPFSADTDHSGSSTVWNMLKGAFDETGRYPHMILSGHVHNFQRFTYTTGVGGQQIEMPCVVAGAGGYTRLGKLHKVAGSYPAEPFKVDDNLTLETYDQDNFGFLRLEITKDTILATYLSAPYVAGTTPAPAIKDQFSIDIAARTVKTVR